MFGKSKKHVIFSPSVYGNSRRNRRMPRWLLSFLAGVFIGGGGLWFLQANYAPPRLTLEQGNELEQTIVQLQQDKASLNQQIIQLQDNLAQANEAIKQLQPITPTQSASHAENPITPIDEPQTNANHIAELVKNLPPDPSNNPVGIRVGNFTGQIGELSYELILSDSQASSTKARVEIVATGHYRNGNRGYEQLQSINITTSEYIRLQDKVKFTKATLTPQEVEVKVVDTQTRRLLGSRRFSVTPMTVEQTPEGN